MSKRKEFTEEQKQEIIRYRREGKSCELIAFFLHCGKERVRRFCKENDIPVGQPSRQNSHYPSKSVAEAQIIYTPYPDFSLAACRGESIQTFFPSARMANGNKSEKLNYSRVVIRAKKFCSDCPVQEKCLDYALLAEPHGIWGGTTEEEREYLRLKLNIKCERDSGLSTRMVRRHLGTHTFKMNNLTKYDLNPIVSSRLSTRV
jgi:WhiB family redox-sensing transcriptional regulator